MKKNETSKLLALVLMINFSCSTAVLNANIKAFNPVVSDWTPECQAIEDMHKAKDDINLFVITPETNSPYSLFEIRVGSVNEPNRTAVCFLDNENGTKFEGQLAKAVKKIEKDLQNSGVPVYDNLNTLAGFLNQKAIDACEMNWM